MAVDTFASPCGRVKYEVERVPYSEICGKSFHFSGSKEFSRVTNSSLTFMHKDSIQFLVQFTRNHSLGGVMVRTVEMDDVNGTCEVDNAFPLLRFVMNNLEGHKVIRPLDTI